MAQNPTVHRFQATLFPVNAYVIETPTHVIAVDATLGLTDARAMRATAAATRKPLAAVIVTHAHPDHYGGVVGLIGDDDIPVYAVRGVDAIIRRDDDAKERILRPMFGDEWARARTFPNAIVDAGQRRVIADVAFDIVDVGPCESPHDSWWIIQGNDRPSAFVGDLVYSGMHAYLADGFYEQWIANLERAKRDLPPDATIFMGHGEPSADHRILDRQLAYIRRFVDTLQRAAFREGLEGEPLVDAVVGAMKQLVPTDDLAFLLRLSVPAMRARLQAEVP